MAITRRYEPIGAIGKLAELSGKAKAERRGQEIAFRTAQAQANRQHQYNIAMMRGDLARRADMRAEQFEYEKMEVRSRHDFELAEMRHQQRVMDAIGKESQIRQKRDTAVEFLEEQHGKGEISDHEYTQAKTQLIAGFRPSLGKAENELDKLLGNVFSGGTAPTAPPVDVSGVAPAGGQVAAPQGGQAPMYATNPKTGQRVASYDGGKTWVPVTTGAQAGTANPYQGYGYGKL
ncbi:MAG: hypothetical protein ACYS6W_17740 [Planctomycetota bacterium]|jgi:hypothetical protein